MKGAVERLCGKLIVSCQAYEDTPLYGPACMRAMAESALLGGAGGIRACWPRDIRAIRSVCREPIIGIYKDIPEGDPLDAVFITASFERARAVIEAGADILGIDCTIREGRGFRELAGLLGEIREAYPEIPIMADLATAEEGVRVAETGLVDILSTTLSGYTRESVGSRTEGPDCGLVRELKKSCDLPVNAEGRIWEKRDLWSVLEAGADMVTIGSAVTRPQEIARRFAGEYEGWNGKRGAAAADGIVREMLSFIGEHYPDKVRLSDVSEQLHYSDTYLNKKFKEIMGTTFTEYLNRYRMQKALELLRGDGGLPIPEVASRCGIGDEKYFRSVFKKYVGCSPRDFVGQMQA